MSLVIKPEQFGTGFDSAGGAVLLPESGPLPNLEAILYSTPDDSGMLTIRGISPGFYRAFVLSLADSLIMMRPDLLMEKYGKTAPLITLSDGERKTITLPVTKIREE